MTMSLAPREERPPAYLRLAFTHGINWLLLAMIVGLVIAVDEGWALALGIGLELTWLGLAPRIPSVRRQMDDRIRGDRAKDLRKRETAMLTGIADADRRRFEELDAIRVEVHRLALDESSFLRVLGTPELERVDRLLGTYLLIAASATRYERYVETTNLVQLERDVESQRRIVDKTTERDPLDLARRNLEVLERRLEKSNAIRTQLRTARGQLNLIENTLKLLRDQLVTMESPQSLTEPLDELLASLDASEAGVVETSALIRALEREATDDSR
jgi:hypothetical protein